MPGMAVHIRCNLLFEIMAGSSTMMRESCKGYQMRFLTVVPFFYYRSRKVDSDSI